MTLDLRHLSGPFDFIGDVHGCIDELVMLLGRLGYRVSLSGRGMSRRASVVPPRGRQAVFVGDYVDRGPNSPDVLRLVMTMVATGAAQAVVGNHDDKFRRWLGGKTVRLTHGLEQTVDQFAKEPAEFHAEVGQFIAALPYCLWLDGGRMAVAHAGIAHHMIGTDTGAARAFSLYGDTDGETDAHGLALRYDWARQHEGPARIVYGHTPVSAAEWRFDTLCIDTACCFGGSLTALRWPENEIVSVPAAQAYAELRRPLGHPPPRPAAKSLP